MKRIALGAACALLTAPPLAAQDEAPALSPADIVNAAPQSEWVVIAPEDMLVMTLAPGADGTERTVVIQLMPPPFSQGWVANIKRLAQTGWFDGTSINRVQDNYVVQWGDPGHDNPEGEGLEKKPLPSGLRTISEAEYTVSGEAFERLFARTGPTGAAGIQAVFDDDPYAGAAGYADGWPIGIEEDAVWPVHCYGMVGVGRNFSPDTGTGAELYTVIGHAPRHLDRNIALVGRIIGGMEHLSSLPRGSGALGFYAQDEADMRTPILSLRLASELPEEERPLYEYLATGTQTFARYVEARVNRRDLFFIAPAGGADICNVPVPVRPFVYDEPGNQ